MNAIIATTTWNSVHLVEIFLAHYRRLGFLQALVMDFDSTDGTRDVLSSSTWSSFVTHVPFPGIAGLDSSRLALENAQRTYAPEDWCLFCDPDEFLVTPPPVGRGIDFLRAATNVGCLTIPRLNVTAERSIAEGRQDRLTPLDALTLRIDRRVHRIVDLDRQDRPLEPAWIYTAIPGKVFVALSSAIEIGDGDHTAVTSLPCAPAPDDIHLLHYPFRSFHSFQTKIALAERDFVANPGLGPGYGWQLRRWIKLAHQNRLFDEYLAQFIPDEDVHRLLLDGTLTRVGALGHDR